MVPRRFSLRTLLAALAVIAMCLAAQRAYRDWYARNYPAFYISTVVHTRIRNGESLPAVLRRFDSMRPVEGAAELATLQRVWRQNGWRIEERDEFFHFSIGSRHGAWIQFRGGHVVNAPGGAHDLDQIAQLNNYPAPPIWLRYGVWPFCILLAAAVLLMGALRRAFLSRRPPVRELPTTGAAS